MELAQKAKSFWERPEGTTGMIFGVGILGALGYGAFIMLPFIITLLANAIYATILGVVLFVLIYVLFIDNRTRNLAWYFYKSAMRAITQMFIEIDPIGILKSYVDDLKDNLGRMDKQIKNLRGQMGILKKNMDENSSMIEQNVKLGVQAKKKGKAAKVALTGRKVGYLQESNTTFQALYNKMEAVYRILSKMYENSEFLIEDIEQRVYVKERERKAIQATHSAFKSAMKIINGDNDKKQMFDQSMDFLAEDYGRKVGEVEHFMASSQSFIEGLDLQNGVFEEDGLKIIEEWEKQSECLILGDGCREEMQVISNKKVAVESKFEVKF